MLILTVNHDSFISNIMLQSERSTCVYFRMFEINEGDMIMQQSGI